MLNNKGNKNNNNNNKTSYNFFDLEDTQPLIIKEMLIKSFYHRSFSHISFTYPMSFSYPGHKERSNNYPCD